MKIGKHRYSYRALLLTVVILIFAASTLFSIQQYLHAVELLERNHRNTAWAMVQLRHEYSRFLNVAQKQAMGEADADELRLRFEILWSRFPVMLEGKNDKVLHQIEGGRELLSALFNEIKTLDSRLNEFAQNPVERREMERFGPPLTHLVNQEFQRNNLENLQVHQLILKLKNIMGICVAGFALSGTILIILVVRDRQRYVHLAKHDALTNLPNRNALNDFLEEELQHGGETALILFDLDGFKDINDEHGHDIGDQVLQIIARRLANLIREKDLAARIGGDEFVIVQTQISEENNFESLARRLIHAIERPISLNSFIHQLGVSIGIAQTTEQERSWQKLLKQADLAMYQAKKDTESAYVLFNPAQFSEENTSPAPSPNTEQPPAG